MNRIPVWLALAVSFALALAFVIGLFGPPLVY